MSLPAPPLPAPLLLLLSLLLLLPLVHTAPPLRPVTRSSTCPVVLPVEPPPAVSRLAAPPRIIGGDVSPSSSLLFTLALRSPLSDSSTRRLCTAARLSTDWGITAAHCAVDTSWTAELPDGTIADVAQVHTHEKYRQVTDRVYDIAVFKLARATDADRVVRVNVRDERPITGAFVRVLGFGAVTSDERAIGIADLRQVDIPVVPFSKCESAYELVSNTGDMDINAQLCAGYLDAGGCDSCVGDSGGPLVQYNSQGKPVLVALVSAGRGCALPGFPGINLRVNKYADWMKSKGAVFDIDDAPVQLVLDGGYPAEPLADEQDPSPKPKPSRDPPPVPPSSDQEASKEPEGAAATPTRTPKPAKDPPVNVQSPQEDSSNVGRPAPNTSPVAVQVPAPSGEFPTVQDPSPSPSGAAATPSPSGGVATPSPSGGVATPAVDNGASSPPPQAEANGNEPDPVTTSNGVDVQASSETKSASVGNDARIAGIVGGSIAGVIVLGGIVALIIKLR